jgi:hypothetical protein
MKVSEELAASSFILTKWTTGHTRGAYVPNHTASIPRASDASRENFKSHTHSRVSFGAF